MATLLERAGHLIDAFAARFRVRRETWPIDNLDEMERFTRTRASFVAQKKLYEYLKTRMGTRYPTVFENESYAVSINIAKLHVFAACLSDLTVHAVARATAGSGVSHDLRSAVAMQCFAKGLGEAAGEEASAEDVAGWREAFERRLADIHWENVAAGHDAFVTSPRALLRWAPIADELKRFDGEIVRNSVRFAWNEVIRDFRNRADVKALVAAISATGGSS